MLVHCHKRKLCGISKGLHHTLNKYGSHIWDHLCSKGRSSIPYAQNKFILKGNIICFDYVGIWRFMAFFFFSLKKKKNPKLVRALALENSNSTLFYHSKKPLYHCQWRFCDKGRKCENGPNLSLSSLEVFIMKNQVQNSKCIMNKRLMVLWQKRITMLVTKM